MSLRLLLPALLLFATPAFAGCPPDGYDKAALQALKATKLEIDDPAQRNRLALELVDCLADPDPELRDGIGYEFLAHWMRSGDFDAAMLRRLRTRLYETLDAPAGEGFAHPFAALVLSEVARTDRVAPWMTEDERIAMVDKAAAYVRSVDDYRGFDNDAGWRHGVAHGADWLMQLALNPALQKPQLDAILQAVSAQVVPADAHAYVFGEPSRLARPVAFIAQRGLHSPQEWTAWFDAFPPRLGEASLAYKDQAWLARRHDLAGFLSAIIVSADGSEQPGVAALEAPARAVYATLP